MTPREAIQEASNAGKLRILISLNDLYAMLDVADDPNRNRDEFLQVATLNPDQSGFYGDRIVLNLTGQSDQSG